MRLRIKRLDPRVPLPAYASTDAAAFDLASAQDVDVPPGAIRLIGTGLIVEVPRGHFLAIFARSSTPFKRGLVVANGVGVLDPDYCGPDDELKVQVLNVTAAPVRVSRGDRLGQGIVLPAPRVEWEEVDEMTGATRGGFGSTGQ
ncbi:MAG: dUTP diphosphatase [Acidobacteria bacterium]|nr:dUTP diphosphatase [Acidobacteriota bacterium]